MIARGIVVNREVEIKRSTGKKDGARTDIFIQAINPADPEDIISLVIEVKGCWNSELDKAMQTQLRDKYLSKHRSRAGLYLIGWFYGEHKQAPKNRRDLKAVKKYFDNQAKAISLPDRMVKPYFLDCRM